MPPLIEERLTINGKTLEAISSPVTSFARSANRPIPEMVLPATEVAPSGVRFVPLRAMASPLFALASALVLELVLELKQVP